jgi:hypothetical protein
MISAAAPGLDVALRETGMTPIEFIEYQRRAWEPTFEELREALTKRPQERDVIRLSAAHLPDEQQAELLKLAVKAPKRKRGRRS